MLSDPTAGGELLEQDLVELAYRSIIDVLNRRLAVPQPDCARNRFWTASSPRWKVVLLRTTAELVNIHADSGMSSFRCYLIVTDWPLIKSFLPAARWQFLIRQLA